ncbi:TPA: hypothetical protein ACIRVE_005103 [Pseudomonas putida]
MIRALLATTLLFSLAGCATTEQLNATNQKLDEVTRQLVMTNQQQLQLMAQVQQDKQLATKASAPGCFLQGKLYSPGSVVAGRICEDVRVVRVSGEPSQWGWRLNL